MPTLGVVSCLPSSIMIKLILEDEPERGVIVKVYRDPTNLPGSTLDRLRRLELGNFGPFYGH